jgi:hypothetical protein
MMLAMTWLLRKSAALIAVYSIALQALLLGFAAPGHFGFDPCLPAFNSPPAVIPSGFLFSPVIFADQSHRLAFLVEAISPQRRHQLQESRAPPIAS